VGTKPKTVKSFVFSVWTRLLPAVDNSAREPRLAPRISPHAAPTRRRSARPVTASTTSSDAEMQQEELDGREADDRLQSASVSTRPFNTANWPILSGPQHRPELIEINHYPRGCVPSRLWTGIEGERSNDSPIRGKGDMLGACAGARGASDPRAEPRQARRNRAA